MFNFKNTTLLKAIIGAVIFILIIVVWYFSNYSKKQAIITEYEDKIEELALELKKIKLKAKSLESLKKEGKEIYIKYKLLENLLPPERNVPDFLDKLYTAAKECGVLIKEISPETPQPIDFYFSDPYALEFGSSYNRMGIFLAKIVNFPVIIIPSDFKVNSVSGDETNPINVTAVLTTYHIAQGEVLEPPPELELDIDFKALANENTLEPRSKKNQPGRDQGNPKNQAQPRSGDTPPVPSQP